MSINLPANIDPYKLRASDPPELQLEALLIQFGLGVDLPVDASGFVDIVHLVQLLPEQLESGLNPAHKELSQYLLAIPPGLRKGGVAIPAETLLGIMLERLEFFEGLSRSLVRMCPGRQCAHFNVCPFNTVVGHVNTKDGIPCAVEREVIRNSVESFVFPSDGSAPKVDPRRPEMGLLFKQLVQLLVKQVRISMHLQQTDILVDNYEILKDGDVERFDSANKMIHPLMQAWDQNHGAIQKLMQQMGLSVDFQIKQGLWIDKNSQVNAERRAVEMATTALRDGFKKRALELPEGSPQRAQLFEAIRYAEDELQKLRGA